MRLAVGINAMARVGCTGRFAAVVGWYDGEGCALSCARPVADLTRLLA